MIPQDQAKLAVARRATELVRDDMIVGLGTGSTASLFIRELAAAGRKIRTAASSEASAELARSLGIPVYPLEELRWVDLYIDGADEVCSRRGRLDLIKGGGGAMLREKIVASSASNFVVIADASKVVDVLGRFPLPVEVIRMALSIVEPRLAKLGLNPKLRLKPAQGGAGPIPFITDEGNYILDCAAGQIEDPVALASEIKSLVGVVEHGLFTGMASLALVAGDDGVREYR